jgi:N-hydroxyarylamine O-acetyltransferase
MYGFDLSPQLPVDYAYANWFLATHAASPFRSSLMLARPVEGGRHGWRQGQYSWRPLQGPPEQQQVGTPEALRRQLDELFGIDPPPALSDARLAALLHNAGR